MVDQYFLNNANGILIVTSDEWTKNFVKSLLDQVNAGRSLSEKQMFIFNKKLDDIISPSSDNPVEENLEFFSKLEGLRNKTKSKWLLGFLSSLETQVKSGKPLTDKQQSVFKSKYDRLVLKIKPAKEEPEDFEEEETQEP